jgi:SAM-dependent methyltransferase
VRLRLRRRRALMAAPPAELLRLQAQWLAPARARLLRRMDVARRRCALDLGASYGAVTGELARRCGGRVVALDRACEPLRAPEAFAGAGRVQGEAAQLPFPAGAFDLVFCQCALLWMPLPRTLDEVARVLQPGGTLVALEPDYGGMIEYPAETATRELWLAGLSRAGADPLLGRKLPAWLEARGFDVRVDLLPELRPPEPARFAFLRDLLTTEAERAALRRVETQGGASVAHLPFFLVTAVKVSR